VSSFFVEIKLFPYFFPQKMHSGGDAAAEGRE
jgi:hypothetical protein